MHLRLLARRDLALDPDEALLGAELVAQLARVEVGQHGGEQLDRLVLVDDVARLGEDRDHLDVGRQHLAVAVDDVGPRRRDLGRGRRGAPRCALSLVTASIDEPPADHAEQAREAERRRGRRAPCSCRRAGGTARARAEHVALRRSGLFGGDVGLGLVADTGITVSGFGSSACGRRRSCPSASRSARAGRAPRACGRSRPRAAAVRAGRTGARAAGSFSGCRSRCWSTAACRRSGRLRCCHSALQHGDRVALALHLALSFATCSA